MIRKFVALALILLFSSSAVAGLKEGVAAYHRLDWQTAVAELTPAAELGSPEAAELLGDYYSITNKVVAAKWYLVAARNSGPEKQYEIGVKVDDAAFRESRRRNDDSEALAAKVFLIAAQCFRMAADAGYAPAQNALGMLYESPWKMAPNVKKAVSLYRQAARQGNAEGLQSMGVVYLTGRPGIRKDLFKSYTFFQAALKYAGNREDVLQFSQGLSGQVETQLSSAQKDRAKALVDAWQPGRPLPGLDQPITGSKLPPG
ncbi:hypothetical protein B0G57_12869 [Trinickia symbiotica]|uniref:Sel1 repeat family protein n=1 Tax=Trinickia symbiotica TaxID=863227 RepID=A0A2N7X5S4_9BURK|nr:tetratricopeptide repeat protein [Trinickia symbiotica]PMS36960.1 sel1 repeat family protein [Trinickia symbiotica]PPK41587.1 hypothetical protein B0G57_12869 [Trinickia symbiotica]